MPLLLSGCFPLTEGLHENITKEEYRDYSESIDSVLITADRTMLVFLGRDYHYIFDAPKGFIELLESPLDNDVEASVLEFVVDGNTVRGSIRIKLTNATADQMRQSKELGFTLKGSSEAMKLFELAGKRYSAKGFDSSNVNKKLLRRSYEVTVREKKSSDAKKLLYVLTPITVAADGLLSIMAIPLVPVVILIAGGVPGPMGH